MSDWNPIQSLIDNAAISDHNNEVAANHVLKYWDAMNAIEKRFADASDDQLADIIAAKTEVHEEFWAQTDDDYWKPCSHGSDEEYSISDIDNVYVMSDYRSSFFVRIAIRTNSSRIGKRDIGYLLQTDDGTEEGPVRIVNLFN